MPVGAGRGNHPSLGGYAERMMKVRVRLDRDSRTWSWKSLPSGDDGAVHSPISFSTAQEAISDAQKWFGPGLTVIV